MAAGAGVENPRQWFLAEFRRFNTRETAVPCQHAMLAAKPKTAATIPGT